MRLITGDECGLIKECFPEAQQSSNGVKWISKEQEQTRTHGVVSLVFVPSVSPSAINVPHEDEGDDVVNGDDLLQAVRFKFAALRMNGTVETWEARQMSGISKERSTSKLSYVRTASTAKDLFSSSIDMSCGSSEVSPPTTLTSAAPVGLACAGSTSSDEPKLLACSSYGHVRVTSSNNAKMGDILEVVAHYDDAAGTKKSNTNGSKFVKNTIVSSFTAHNDMAAIGGRDRETIVMNVETGQISWKAKNLPPDPQTLLQHPIWSTAIQFLTETASLTSGSSTLGDSENISRPDSCLLAVGTAYKQLRIYDTRAQRRPILTTANGVLDHRITSLCQFNATQLAIGDAVGNIHCIDIRKMSAAHGRYVGPAGSVRQMVCHPKKQIFACVGLDRMLRIYDIRTRKNLHTVYLKQRLNSVLFCDDAPIEDAEDGQYLVGSEHDAKDGADKIANLEEEDNVIDYVNSSEEDDVLSSNADSFSSSETNSLGSDDDLDEADADASEDGTHDREDEYAGLEKKKPRR